MALSRGGTEAWYRGIADRYVEIWDDLDPAEYARRNAQRPTTKQYELSDLDGDVLAAATRRLGTDDVAVLHPGMMYRLFTLYWSGQRAMGFVDSHVRFTRVEAPQVIDRHLLPPEYIAAKFYAARSLPDTPDIRAQLRRIVDAASERLPVVLLDTGLELERNNRPTADQRLHLLNSSHIRKKIEQGSGLRPLLRLGPKRTAQELYLATLSRPPTPQELETVSAYVKSRAGPTGAREAWVDVAWALINSHEFLCRH